MRRFLLILFPAVLMFTSLFTSCIKNLEDEGIYVTTRCYGIVYDQQTMQPIPGIMIASTDGKKIEEKVYTQDDGSFSINISLEQLHRGCYLSVLPDSLYQTLDIKLDGMPLGLQNYDLGSIVIEGPSEPIIYTDNVTDITINSAHCYGEILEDGHSAITERGFVYAEVQYPTVEDNKVVVETTNKTFDAILSLKPNTTYYVRAFARNGLGLSYGDQIEFSTLSGLPEVTTNGVYNITSTTAVCAANVNGNDMFPDTYRGVCWSTMPDPDINNTHTLEGYGMTHLLAVNLIADGEVNKIDRIKLQSHRLFILVDRIGVNFVCINICLHSCHIDRCVAESSLQGILGTDVEHILLLLTHHPLFSTEHLEHIATVVELIAPLLVESSILRLKEGEVQLSVETLAHVVLKRDVSTIVASVTLVDQRLFHVIEQAVHRTVGASVDAHRDIETILIVGIETQVQVIHKLIHIGGKEMMSL